VKISQGNETYTVAFLPRIYYLLPKINNNINNTVQVVKLYKNGNTYEQQKDQVNRGMASVILLSDVPISE
jgi:hypothetical protein